MAAYDAHEGDHTVTGSIMQKIDTARQERLPDARTWDLCLAFLEGRQYLTWDKLQNQFINMPQATGRSRVVINKLLNKYRNIVSKLSAQYPSMVVTSIADSYEDVTKSEGSELSLRWYYQDQDMPEKFGELTRWGSATGNGALHTSYDERAKKIVTKVVSPYNLFWEPGVNNPAEALWAAVMSLVPRQELIDTYPDFKAQLEEITSESQRDQKRPGGGFTQGGLQVPDDRLAFYEVIYKDGHCEFRCGPDLVLHTWETPGKVFPLQFFRYTDVPGRLWGLGLLVQLLDLQSMYNRARNMVFDSGELMANPMWMIPKNSGLTNDSITNSPGKKVFYNASAPEPHQVKGAELPAYFQNSIHEIDQEMNDVAGTNDVQLGKRPVNFSSGTAIKEMTDNATSQLQMTQDNLEKCAKDHAKVVLVYMQAYYTEGQFIKIFNVNGRTLSRTVKSSDLISMPSIFLEAGSLFRDEAQDRDQKTMQLFQAKLISPEDALKRLSMHIGNRDAVKNMVAYAHAEELLAASTGARDKFDPVEQRMLMKGVEIWPTDDLNAIQEVFMEYVRSAGYSMLPDGRQQYVRDILMAVRNFGKGLTPGQMDQANNQKVWPIQTPDPREAAQLIAGSSNDEAGQQIAQEAQTMADRGQDLQNAQQGIPAAPSTAVPATATSPATPIVPPPSPPGGAQ